MNWLFQLHTTQPVAQAIGILALVCVAGLALGHQSVRGIKLGTAGVLFAGIITGSFSKPVDHATLEFVKEFGLILFVFTIGLQLGPGFISALRRDGLRLNAVAAGIVLSGSALAVILAMLLGMDLAGGLGMLSGATTNTTSLGAAQQSLSTLPGMSEDRLALPALAYAVSYPAAIVGILAALLLLVRIFRIDTKKEAAIFAAEQQRLSQPPARRTPLDEQSRPAQTCEPDVQRAPSTLTERPIVVTHKGVLGKTVGELALDTRCGAVVSHVTRANVELTAVPGLRLQFGDLVQAIGDEASLERAESLLGNSIKEIDETHFVAFFAGIVLGIVVGTMPIIVPGLPQPLRLGLAGGPLVVALALGTMGHIGPLVFHMPVNTNLAFREFGIALFFSAVGLAAGPKFFESVFSANGLLWLGGGVCVTVVPMLIAGVFARAVLHMNFTVLGGLLAGSLTDPPALAFVNNLAGSDAPTLAYVTVYPLTTLLRILVVQVLALTLVR